MKRPRRKKNKRSKQKCYSLWCFIALVLGGGVGFLGFKLTSEPSKTVDITDEQIVIEVRFEKIIPFIVEGIDQAEHTIYMMAYSFDAQEIGDALLRAKERGVQIFIIVDKGQYESGKAPQIDRLNGQVDKIYIDTRSSYAHDKVLIIDERIVFSGSFNFDKRADEHNRENSVKVTNDRRLCKKYLDHWQKNARRITNETKQGSSRKKKTKRRN